jgi:hypothetical protein
MSFQATKFVRALRGLTPAEKAVAFVLADHANQYGGNSYPSMDLIAEEAGFKDRRSAQRYMRRLEEKRVVVAMSPKTGGHGHDTATIYKLDFAMRCDSTAAPPVTDLDDGGVTVQTVRGDSTGPEGRQYSRSKKYEEGDKREWQEPTSSSLQEPHTTSFTNTMEEKEEGEIKPDQTSDASVPLPSKTISTPNRPVQGSKKECAAAPVVARLQAEILRIPLTNGRTFQCNGKVNAIIAEELTKGRSAALILQAAKYIGRTLPDRDRMPGLTLADNLAARIIAMELEQAAAVEVQKEQLQRREMAAEQERLEAERSNREKVARAQIKREEVAAQRERSDWTNEHGNCDAFVPTNPAVLYRADLEDRLERAYRDGSINRSELWVEAKKLQAEALQAQLAAEGDGEPEPFY